MRDTAVETWLAGLPGHARKKFEAVAASLRESNDPLHEIAMLHRLKQLGAPTWLVDNAVSRRRKMLAL